jgi:hypothetical protein
MKKILLTLLLLLPTVSAHATVYWASSSGNNSATCSDIDSVGTADAPGTDPGSYGTILRAAVCATAAGDVVNIKAGTYTTNLKIHTGSNCTGTCLKAGTSTNRTYLQGDPGGARPVIQSTTGFLFMPGEVVGQGRDFLTIRYLDIDGSPEGGSDAGISTVALGGANIIFEHNIIRNSAHHPMTHRGESSTGLIVRYNDIYGYGNEVGGGYCIYAGASGITWEYNKCHDAKGGGPHLSNSTFRIDNTVMRYSSVYNMSMGTAPWAAAPGCFGVVANGLNVQIYNNYLDGASCLSGASGSGIAHGYKSGATSKIYNNTVKNWRSSCIAYGNFIVTTSNDIKNNICMGNVGGNIRNESANGSTFTSATNACSSTTNCGTSPLVIAAITACTVSTTDPTQKSGSSCIDQGTAISGHAFNGSAPDIGAFETIPFSSASVDLNVMDVTLEMNRNTPVIPSSGITGFTVACSGSNCGTPVVASAARKTGADGVVRLTISGIGGTGNCDAAQTWTVSYTPGNVTDSILVGNTLTQSLHAFTTQPVADPCSGSATPPPATGLHVDLPLDENTGTSAVDLEGNANGTLTGSTLPSWVTGKTGSALSFPDGSVESHLAIAYGSGLNPSSSSLSICLGVLPHSTSSTQKIVFSTDNGTSQRFYIGWIGGTWGIGIQGSPFTTGSEFPLVAEWTRLCLVANSDGTGDQAADTATLYVNGVKGVNAQVVKTYTSYTLASNFKVGVGPSSVNYGGSTADDIKIYAATALTDQEVADDYAAWNPSTPEPTGTYEQKTHKWQRLRKKVDGSAEDFTISGTTNGITMSVMVGGAVILVTQIDCTVADCDPAGVKLHYSKNSGAWLAVPDACVSDGVCFYGTTDVDVVSGTIECCLAGALTENDGPTNTTASAVPVFDLSQNGSFVRRSVLKFGSSVADGDSFCFKEYHQTDLELNGGYTPSAGACVTIVSVSAGIGF